MWIVEAGFEGGAVTSNIKLLLVRETERKLGLTRAISKRAADQTQNGNVEHSVETMRLQQVMGLYAGYEDPNDLAQKMEDPLHEIVAGTDKLASAPALCRFENQQLRQTTAILNLF